MQNIILLHGALGSAEDLSVLAQQMAKRNLKTHRFSFSGHGNTPFQNEFSITRFAEELHDYILKNRLENPCIFGYSMGGYVALYLASKQILPLNTIVTLGTKFNWSRLSVEKETALLKPELMLQKVPAFAKTLEQKHGDSWKLLVQRTADLMWDIHANEFLNEEALKRVTIKTIIGLGDKDQMVSLEETYLVYKMLPVSNMYMLPGTKHPMETVNTTLLCDTVLPLLT